MNDYLVGIAMISFYGGIACVVFLGMELAADVINHYWPEDPAWPDNRENDPYDTRKEDVKSI